MRHYKIALVASNKILTDMSTTINGPAMNCQHKKNNKESKMGMLDGVELDKQLGDVGHLKIDVTNDLKIIAEIAVKKEIDLVSLLEAAVQKSETKLDDQALEILKKAIAILKK